MSLAILFHFLCAEHVIAKEAKIVHEYKNIKRRLHKTTAAIWYCTINHAKKLVFYSSTITMMHGPINIRLPHKI